MQTANFVKLVKLVDFVYEDETAEQQERWLRNVLNSVGEDAYTIADDGSEYITRQFTTDEIEFAYADCYMFIGSAYEDERFYAQDWLVVKERATGDLYAYETQQIYEGAF
jgi:hypothetical protein